MDSKSFSFFWKGNKQGAVPHLEGNCLAPETVGKGLITPQRLYDILPAA